MLKEKMQDQVYIMRSWCERKNHLEGVVQHSPRETYIILYNFDIEMHVYVTQMLPTMTNISSFQVPYCYCISQNNSIFVFPFYFTSRHPKCVLFKIVYDNESNKL